MLAWGDIRRTALVTFVCMAFLGPGTPLGLARAADVGSGPASTSGSGGGASGGGSGSGAVGPLPRHTVASRQYDPSAGAARRGLAATMPSTISNGSAAVAFPSASFAAWCASDAACNAAAALALTLSHYTDASPYTAATLGWPNVFSGPGISGLTLVSGVVELQPQGLASKLDQTICSAASPCSATLSIPLTSAADASKVSLCMRLEPTILGSSYQARGFPAGSNGTAVVGTPTNNVLQCSTTKFGRHVILQYTQAPLVPPPSPPPPVPPMPPPPPPVTTGDIYDTEVQMAVAVALSVPFESLQRNASLLAALSTSLSASMTSSLNLKVPPLLQMRDTVAGSLTKISRYAPSPTTAVSFQFLVVVPVGASQNQVATLQALIVGNTTGIFDGASYQSLLLGPATVAFLAFKDDSLSNAAVGAITVGAIAAGVLALLGLLALYRWRIYVAILPKKPQGEWDEYGTALVQPRHKPHHRKSEKQSNDEDDDAGGSGGGASPNHGKKGAAPAHKGSQPAEPDPMAPPGVQPPPWHGANAPGGGGGGGEEAGGGAVSPGAGRVPGGPRNARRVKGEAELPTKHAWGAD